MPAPTRRLQYFRTRARRGTSTEYSVHCRTASSSSPSSSSPSSSSSSPPMRPRTAIEAQLFRDCSRPPAIMSSCCRRDSKQQPRRFATDFQFAIGYVRRSSIPAATCPALPCGRVAVWPRCRSAARAVPSSGWWSPPPPSYVPYTLRWSGGQLWDPHDVADEHARQRDDFARQLRPPPFSLVLTPLIIAAVSSIDFDKAFHCHDRFALPLQSSGRRAAKSSAIRKYFRIRASHCTRMRGLPRLPKRRRRHAYPVMVPSLVQPAVPRQGKIRREDPCRPRSARGMRSMQMCRGRAWTAWKGREGRPPPPPPLLPCHATVMPRPCRPCLKFSTGTVSPHFMRVLPCGF